jgi:hypothetical protein
MADTGRLTSLTISLDFLRESPAESDHLSDLAAVAAVVVAGAMSGLWTLRNESISGGE